MFYGRVDVFWPDGPIESYRLNKPTVAIGRSTGNDIVLDTTAISRYHISLTFNTNQQALLEDLESVNGTYVDSIRLKPHEPFVLRGGEEIQIGDIRLIFHPPVPAETVPGEAETTKRVVLTRPTFQIELLGPEMAISPGAHVQATLKIENAGTEPDRYFVEVDGLPKNWVRVDRVELDIDPGEQASVVISFRPLRRSESLPGDYPFTVHVRSRSQPAETIDAPATLRVLPYSGFGMALDNPRVSEDGSFKLYLHNQGNAPLPLTIQGFDADHLLRFQLSHTRVRLGPGERQTVTGGVRSRRYRLFGSRRELEFAVFARAQDPSGFLASVPGTVTEKAALPAWTPLLVIPVIALAAMLGALAIVLLSGGHSQPEPAISPVINAFMASAPGITLGEPDQVVWDVADAEALTLYTERAGQQQQYVIDPTAASFTLNFDQTGRYTLTLEARNKELVTTATAQVDVRPAVTLNLQVLHGVDLVRNVQHDIQVNWMASGAMALSGGYSLWLESSDPTGTLLPAPLPLAGQQVVQVTPRSDQSEWLVTLYAQGQDNVVASVTQKLTIVYPICELRAPQTIVRSGPGTVYPAIMPPQPPEGSPAGTLSYSPVARDPSGKWLEVNIGVEDRPGWVPLQDFACTNFDPNFLVSTTDYPAPPVSTPLPTETITATSTGPVPTITPSSTRSSP
jgi:pSer/pThr/pTyr-binding forkhead associated (FHA) protein